MAFARSTSKSNLNAGGFSMALALAAGTLLSVDAVKDDSANCARSPRLEKTIHEECLAYL